MASRKRSSNISIRCDICHIRLNQNAWMNHVQGRRHSELLAKGYALQECVRRSLFVVGFPKQTSKLELLDYFAKFASVADIFMDRKDNKFAIVELNDVDGADRIFFQKHFFNGVWLNVKRRAPKNDREKPTKKNDNKQSNKIAIDMNAISEKLLSAVDFDDQIQSLINTMVMPEEELNKKMEVCKELETLMKGFFPNCQAVPYGSNVSGLGTKECDLDIFVDLNLNRDFPMPEMSESDGMQMLAELRRDLKHFRHVPNEKFLNKVACLDPRMLIQLLSTIIKKYFPGCTNVFSVKSPRCPIVSFFMPKLNIDCDVSIKNSLGVHNSVLIGWYCKFDTRVVHFLFLLRVWAKQVGVCDAKTGRFSSYAITMIGLFYLQHCKPPVIPTIEFLQSLDGIEVLCSGWNCHFCMDKSKVPPSFNQETVGQLFKGFFKFYFEHPLTDFVICLRTARFCVKEDFIKHIEADERLCEFKLKTFNVQDPFELNFNLATSVNEQAEKNWTSAILIAHQVCSCDVELLNGHNGQFWGLAKLLFSSPPDTTKVKKELMNSDEFVGAITYNGYTYDTNSIPVKKLTGQSSKDLVFIIPNVNANIDENDNSSNIYNETIGSSSEDVKIISEHYNNSAVHPEFMQNIENVSAQEEQMVDGLLQDDEIKVTNSAAEQTEVQAIPNESINEVDKSEQNEVSVITPENPNNEAYQTSIIKLPIDGDSSITEPIVNINLTTDVSSTDVNTKETISLEDFTTNDINTETLNLKVNEAANPRDDTANAQFSLTCKPVVENNPIVRKEPLLPLPTSSRFSTPKPVPLSSIKLQNFRFHPYNTPDHPRIDEDGFIINYPNRMRTDYYGHDDRFNAADNLRGNKWGMQQRRGSNDMMCNSQYNRMEADYCPVPPMRERCFRDFYGERHSLPDLNRSNSPSFSSRKTIQPRVTPAKPKKSRITAISENFTIVTCGMDCIERVNSAHINGLEAGPVLPEFQPCNLWSYDTMREILSVALRLECEVLSDMENTDKTPLLLLLKAYKNTWVDRKAARAAIQGNNSEPIITESKISDYLIKKYPSVSPEPLFICHCFILNVKEESQFVLRVKLELITTMNKEFVNFTTFLKSITQKIFSQLAHSKKTSVQ